MAEIVKDEGGDKKFPKEPVDISTPFVEFIFGCPCKKDPNFRKKIEEGKAEHRR